MSSFIVGLLVVCSPNIYYFWRSICPTLDWIQLLFCKRLHPFHVSIMAPLPRPCQSEKSDHKVGKVGSLPRSCKIPDYKREVGYLNRYSDWNITRSNTSVLIRKTYPYYINFQLNQVQQPYARPVRHVLECISSNRQLCNTFICVNGVFFICTFPQQRWERSFYLN